jgi:hypothetical protein
MKPDEPFVRHAVVVLGASLLVTIVAAGRPASGAIPIPSPVARLAPRLPVVSGVRWSVVPSINPGPQGTSNDLSSISCVTQNSCVTVGESDYQSGKIVNLAESWNGHIMSLLRSFDSGPSVGLSSVSCVSLGMCATIGLTSNGSTVLGSWRGTSTPRWSLVPGESSIYLDSLSCTGALCVAVGLKNPGTDRKTFIEVRSGARWSTVPSPNRGPLGDFDDLTSTSCVSLRFCVAVGAYGQQTAHRLLSSRTLIEMWQGHRWFSVSSPNEGSLSNLDVLSGVSCYSPTMCVAVGNYASYGGLIQGTLIERWDGSSWTVMKSPNRGGLQHLNELTGVSCPSRDGCVAVGSYEPTNGVQLRNVLVEAWSGGPWRLITSPTASASSDASLAGIDCATVDSCLAVGEVSISASRPDQTLVETQRTAGSR